MRSVGRRSAHLRVRAFGLAGMLVALVLPRDSRAEDSPRDPSAITPPASPSPPPPPAPASNRGELHESVVVWPTLSPAGDQGGAAAHRPSEGEQGLFVRAQELDATLRDAVQDLGFVLHVSDPGPRVGRTRDIDLVERAARDGALAASGQTDQRGQTSQRGTWVISPRIEVAGADSFVVRIVAVPPKGNVLRVRVEQAKGADVAVRGLVMLRELLSPVAAAQAAAGASQREGIDATAGQGVVATNRSAGRAVLATSGTLFGGFVAYGLQRASGNEDPRVLYPLLALGAGVGLGGSLLAAEEWDIGAGDAWFLAGGTWWATASGILLANGYEVKPLSDRYNYGAGAGLLGLGLSTFALTRTRMDEGDAVLTHSGATLGLGLGALAEMFVEGSVTAKPALGAGYGSAIGLVGAGTLASFVTVPPSRVLLVDVGAGLGALAGAAAGSPLVFEDVSTNKARGFVAATAGGAVLGAGVALFFTRGSTKKQTVVGKAPRETRAKGLEISPLLGPIPASTPAFGAGAIGTF